MEYKMVTKKRELSFQGYYDPNNLKIYLPSDGTLYLDTDSERIYSLSSSAFLNKAILVPLFKDDDNKYHICSNEFLSLTSNNNSSYMFIPVEVNLATLELTLISQLFACEVTNSKKDNILRIRAFGINDQDKCLVERISNFTTKNFNDRQIVANWDEMLANLGGSFNIFSFIGTFFKSSDICSVDNLIFQGNKIYKKGISVPIPLGIISPISDGKMLYVPQNIQSEKNLEVSVFKSDGLTSEQVHQFSSFSENDTIEMVITSDIYNFELYPPDIYVGDEGIEATINENTATASYSVEDYVGKQIVIIITALNYVSRILLFNKEN